VFGLILILALAFLGGVGFYCLGRSVLLVHGAIFAGLFFILFRVECSKK
jgi:hypothetical protein